MITIRVAPQLRLAESIDFVVRPVRGPHELLEAARLRYRVYAGAPGTSHHRSLHSEYELDLDAHDARSEHLALFARSEGRESLVGTLRLTTRRVSSSLAGLHAIAASRAGLVARLTAAVSALPMLEYLAERDAIECYLRERMAAGECVAEAGRFAIDPRILRLAGRAGLRLSHHLICTGIAYATRFLGIDRVLLTSEPHLEPLYRRFGFTSLACRPDACCAAAGVRYRILEATPDAVPSELRGSIASLALQLRTHRRASLGVEKGEHTTVLRRNRAVSRPDLLGVA